jgi:hypothetical protein
MTDNVLHGLALALATAGMAMLALGLSAHWRQFAGARPLTGLVRIGLRVAGGALIGAAFAACVAADPLSMAVLVWTTILTIAAGIIAAVVTVHARLSAS